MAGSDHSKQNSADLGQMSTEALKELLDAKVAAGDEDDLLYDLLEVIDQRDAENPNGELADVDKAWADFQKYYNVPEGDGRSLFADSIDEESAVSAIEKPTSNPKKHHYSFRHLVVAAIAAAVIIALLVPTVFGLNLWKIMGQWTEDIFTFTKSFHAKQRRACDPRGTQSG